MTANNIELVSLIPPTKTKQKHRRENEQRKIQSGHDVSLGDEMNFVVVPKLINEPFFDEAYKGCESEALVLGKGQQGDKAGSSPKLKVTCHYIGTSVPHAHDQANVIRSLVDDPELYYNLSRVDGIAVAVLDDDVTTEAINYATDRGVPVVTFDADAPKSNRRTFISTNNYAFGLELGKVLTQINPNGTYYGMITGVGPNLDDRLRGVRDRLNNALSPTKWKEVLYSPLNCQNDNDLALEQMFHYAQDSRIRAIVPVAGWPMFNTNTTRWKSFVEQHPHITTVVGDSVQVQLELLSSGFVDGLVGQVPFQMGQFVARELFRIWNVQKNAQEGFLHYIENDLNNKESDINSTAQFNAAPTVLGTHLLEVLRIPLELPPYEVNHNHLGNAVWLGYTMVAITGLLSVGFIFFIWIRRNSKVIRASQPIFLVTICAGALTLGSSIVPLSMDDSSYHSLQEAGSSDNESRTPHSRTDMACMSFVWLVSIGFTTIFAALFSKTRRILTILKMSNRFQRVKVGAKDVLLPFVCLLIANIATLTIWNALSPLQYIRQAHLGTDDWNRILSTYGTCRVSPENTRRFGSLPYAIVLFAVNAGVLLVANIYAYRARHIQTEYSESRYIAIIMASMMQALLIGGPIAFLTQSQPLIAYVVIVCLISVVCLSVLLFIFIPKISAYRRQEQTKKNVRRQTTLGHNESHDEENGRRQKASLVTKTRAIFKGRKRWSRNVSDRSSGTNPFTTTTPSLDGSDHIGIRIIRVGSKRFSRRGQDTRRENSVVPGGNITSETGPATLSSSTLFSSQTPIAWMGTNATASMSQSFPSPSSPVDDEPALSSLQHYRHRRSTRSIRRTLVQHQQDSTSSACSLSPSDIFRPSAVNSSMADSTAIASPGIISHHQTCSQIRRQIISTSSSRSLLMNNTSSSSSCNVQQGSLLDDIMGQLAQLNKEEQETLLIQLKQNRHPSIDDGANYNQAHDKSMTLKRNHIKSCDERVSTFSSQPCLRSASTSSSLCLPAVVPSPKLPQSPQPPALPLPLYKTNSIYHDARNHPYDEGGDDDDEELRCQ